MSDERTTCVYCGVGERADGTEKHDEACPVSIWNNSEHREAPLVAFEQFFLGYRIGRNLEKLRPESMSPTCKLGVRRGEEERHQDVMQLTLRLY